MIIWQGFGFLGLLIPMAFYAAGYALGDRIFGEGFSAHHGWLSSVSILLSAMAVFLLDMKLSDGLMTVREAGTGRPVRVRRKHSLLFLPLRYFALLIVGFAIYILLNPQASV